MFKLPKLFTTKWKNIHPDFTRELKEEWKNRGFSYKETKEWIDIGLTPEDFAYAQRLRDVKEKNPNWVLMKNHGDAVKSRRKRNNYSLSSQGLLSSHITEKETEELLLDADILKKTIEVPVPDSQPAEFKIDAQTYLEQNYPTPADKVNCQVLNLGTKDEDNPDGLEIKLTGSLDLTGFTNLKRLWCNVHKITQLNLKSCSRLEELECWENELTELDVSNCQNIKNT